MPTAARAAPAGPAAEDGKTEVISVTDTSVEHTLRTGRAPVTVVTRADLVNSGRATLGDILQGLPAQANAANAQVNAGGDGATRINLRGLGAPRTLVLLNGRRVVNGGFGADGAVDLNMIPLPMIERVEVLKDGASALYGADAVGGVVNVITRPRFDGTDVSLLTSTSQRGDGTEYDLGAVTGFTSSDKRTYVVLSGGYQRHDPVFAGDRSFSSFQDSYDFATRRVSHDASLAAPNGRLDATSIGPGGMASGTHLPGCGSDVCKPDGAGWSDFVTPGDLYNEAPGNYLYTPSARYSVFGTAGNRLNDDAALFLEASYLHRTSSRELSPVAFVADTPISKDSIYNLLGGDILDFRRRITELGPRHFSDTLSMIRVVAGITGNVPASWGILKDWKYELSEDYGDNQSKTETTGQLLLPHVADSLGPSMRDATGTAICVRKPDDPSTQIFYRVPFGDSFRFVPCVPVNLLAPAGMIPLDQLQGLTYTDGGGGNNNLHTLLATASGHVAELPDHGDISLSLGGDYRYERGSQVPSTVAAVTLKEDDPTRDYTTDNGAQPTNGRLRMYEGFGELAIVPLSGHDIAQHVELDLGARVLHHNRSGSSLTYKAGGLFRTVHGISARGTYATAFRAPALFDLFGGLTQRTPAAEDPCDTQPPSLGDGARTLDPTVQAQCTAQGVPEGSRFGGSQQVARVGGNPALQPETARTVTFGVVVEPPQVKGLTITADYWHIAIDDAIESLGVGTIFANCYDRGLSAFCDQIERNTLTHRIKSVDQSLQNVSRTVTSGIDVGVWHDTRFPRLGRIRSGLEGQYLLRYDLETGSQVVHGAGYYDLGVYPRFKANLSSNWLHPGGASGGFNLRFVGSYKECAGNDCNNERNLAEASRDVDRYVKLDLFGGYDLHSRAGRTTLQLGVNNVLDTTPPVVYNAAAANSDAATYDFVGRLVYVRLSQLF